MPYGDEIRELMVVPAVAVNVLPRMAVVPRQAAAKSIEVRVEMVNNLERGGSGELRLKLPDGWTSSPAAANAARSR